MEIGVYIIRNSLNDKFYVGISRNIDKRIKQHKSNLRNQKHVNKHLQNSYNINPSSLSYEILILCEYEIAKTIEESFTSQKNRQLYNIRNGGEGGDTISNNPNRNEIVSKMSKSTIEKYAQMSADERKSIFGKQGDKNGMFGRHQTDKAKDIIAMARNKKIIVNGVVYKNLKTCAKAFNVTPTAIIKRIRSKTDKFKDYFYYDD